MTDPFIGEISIFAGTYAPKGWAFCNGQLLAINQNQALFSLLGTSYGGDGQKTFALPDLRSRVPVHAGTESGLPDVALGEKGGSIPNSDEAQSGYSAGPYLGVNFIIAMDGVVPAARRLTAGGGPCRARLLSSRPGPLSTKAPWREGASV